MSASPQSSNEVFAFSVPVVKGPRIEFALRVATGLAPMFTGRSLALTFARSIAEVCGFELVARAKLIDPAKAAIQRTAEKREIYTRVYRAYRAGGYKSMRSCARQHGLSYGTWYEWCNRHSEELERGIAANPPVRERAPITKPGGGLL